MGFFGYFGLYGGSPEHAYGQSELAVSYIGTNKVLRRWKDVEIKAATTPVKGYCVSTHRDSQKGLELGG